MMKSVRLPLFVFAGLALLIGFQNCGQVQVAMQESKAPPGVTEAASHLTAQACVNSVSVAPEKTKFIFVLDLSRSNIGEFYKGKYLFNGKYYDNYQFFNPATGTDPTGIRFDTISNFISNCASSGSADYAVIGFSNAAGSLTRTGSSNSFECKNQFTDAAGVQTQMNAMKQAQREELSYYSQFREPSAPFLSKNNAEITNLIYKETNYVSAVNCISSTIEADLAKATADATSNYQVFFISDGEAYATDTGCEAASVTDKVACYTQLMNTKLSYLMKLSSAKAKPVRIHSMYYSANGAQNLKIENYLSYLSSIGQTNSPINLGSLKNDQDGQNPLCKLLAVDKSVIYRSNRIYAVNTNVIKVGKVLKKDTDQDGIPDDEEKAFGSDPKFPRSMVSGVLDGVCKIIGSKALCQQARDQINCDENKINAFNMSDCDIKILKLDKTAISPELAGIDSDGDGIPDYVEILKGLSPMNNDAYLDYDGDGLTNMQEISLGLDPFTPDAEDQQLIKSDSVFRDRIDGCTSGGWELNVSALSGESGANNLLLYFRTESKNTPGVLEYRMSKTSFDLNKSNDQNWIVRLTKDYVQISDFVLVNNGAAP